MNRYCTHCGDEYDPVEYREPPVDPDEPEFCSNECEEAYWREREFQEIYNSGRYGGAQVFGS